MNFSAKPQLSIICKLVYDKPSKSIVYEGNFLFNCILHFDSYLTRNFCDALRVKTVSNFINIHNLE